jgi:hypothetical protein
MADKFVLGVEEDRALVSRAIGLVVDGPMDPGQVRGGGRPSCVDHRLRTRRHQQGRRPYTGKLAPLAAPPTALRVDLEGERKTFWQPSAFSRSFHLDPPASAPLPLEDLVTNGLGRRPLVFGASDLPETRMTVIARATE